jgi:alpha-tubulin suppressor-like RCC1 family protein
MKTDYTLWSWGTAAGGLLGNGTTSPNISSPAQVGSLTDWKQIDADDTHSMAVKTDGTLWGWGSKNQGLLGNSAAGGYEDSPVQIGALTDWLQVSAGRIHTMAIKTDNTLWAVGGSGWYGCFGNGVAHDWSAAALSSPVQIGSETDWIQVKCGEGHTHAIRAA